MRREDNFQELVKNKKIIIPIIQRDYAQGRNNTKAISVRTRLIDEWIDILKDPNLRMDFNYIYGNGGCFLSSGWSAEIDIAIFVTLVFGYGY